MPILVLTWWTLTPLALVISAAATTVARLVDTYHNRRLLYRSRHLYSPWRFAELELAVAADIEREWVRIAKHGVCISAVSLMFAAPLIARIAEVRNWMFVAISLGLMYNSLRDAAFHRRMAARYRKRIQLAGRTNEDADESGGGV